MDDLRQPFFLLSSVLMPVPYAEYKQRDQLRQNQHIKNDAVKSAKNSVLCHSPFITVSHGPHSVINTVDQTSQCTAYHLYPQSRNKRYRRK